MVSELVHCDSDFAFRRRCVTESEFDDELLGVPDNDSVAAVSLHWDLGLEVWIIDRESSDAPLHILRSEFADEPCLDCPRVLATERNAVECTQNRKVRRVHVVLAWSELLGFGAIDDNDCLLGVIHLQFGVLADVCGRMPVCKIVLATGPTDEINYSFSHIDVSFVNSKSLGLQIYKSNLGKASYYRDNFLKIRTFFFF